MQLRNEPVMLGGAIRAVILAATAFGLNWSAEQVAAIMLAVEAVLSLFTRSQVTPNGLAEYRVSQGGSPTQPLAT